MQTFIKKLTLTLDMIKFQHSIFALPFALASLFFATNGYPSATMLLLIILCMITARNTAMTFNRIVDYDIDKKNPRTASRPLVNGTLSMPFSIAFCVINALIFILFTYFLNDLAFYLSPLALLILLGYSLTKRFTHFTQFFLGLALGISPVAAWIAVTGEISSFSLFLGGAVLFWVAGFDLIYSSLDYEFDKTNNLKNIVVLLGIPQSLMLSRFFHLISFLLFLLAGWTLNVGWIYYFGILVMGSFLIYEHSLVKASDLSKVDAAFFTMNGYIAMSFLIFSLIEIYIS